MIDLDKQAEVRKQAQRDFNNFVQFVFGTNMQDPELPARLLTEQQALRNKYALPDRVEFKDDYPAYGRTIKSLLTNSGLEIVYDLHDFLQKKGYDHNADYKGVYDRETKILHFSSDFDWNNTQNVLNAEHEYVHHLQQNQFPEIYQDPIKSEYEAHIAVNITPTKVKNPNFLYRAISFMYGSIRLQFDQDNLSYPWSKDE